MRKKIIELANIEADQMLSVEFRAEFPHGISGALRIMEIGHYYYWDADDFNRHSFHAIAGKMGIRIATKRCKKVSCFVVMRIA